MSSQTFEIGEPVLGKTLQGWATGTISSVNDDGTYDIMFEGNKIGNGWKPKNVKPLPKAGSAASRPEPYKKVLCIYTGGTIGMKMTELGYAPEKDYFADMLSTYPQFHDGEVEAIYKDLTLPGMGRTLVTPKTQYDTRIVYNIYEYDPLLDSSCMGMEEWMQIAQDVVKFKDDYHGFVVIHGTDTMGYTSSALSFMLENLDKSVVITGSQVPMVEQRNDGRENFLGALLIAAQFEIPEVTLFFNNKLLRGCRTVKSHASGFDAFSSPNLKPLADVGIGVDVNWQSVWRAPQGGVLRCATKLCKNIAVLRIFPGIPAATVRQLCAEPIEGVVLQTYGAGNAPDNRPPLIAALKAASDRGVLIVNITQCYQGNVAAHYATGTVLVRAGVIPGRDMTTEAALTKLSYVCALDVSNEEKRKLMNTNLRGEFTVSGAEKRFAFKDMSFVKEVAKAMNASDPREMAQIREAIHPILMCSAAGNGRKDIVEELITGNGLDVGLADYDQRTALHLAAAEGQMEVVDFLLEKGASVHATDRNGNNALHDAILHKRSAIIKKLRDAGAKIDYSDRRLAEILNSLSVEGDAAGLRYWIEAGANVSAGDYDLRTPLHISASEGHEQTARALVEAGANVNATDRFGYTPLWEAATNRNQNLCEYLVKQGAKLGQEASKLASALCAAAATDDAELIGLLGLCGADLGTGDYDKRTALHVAVCQNKANAAQQLLRLGAPADAKDIFGKTPAENATEYKVGADILSLLGTSG